MLLRYRPDLDGLRSVAVYLVLFFHAGLLWAGGGFIGVDLFFVLSGFLVTGVLLGEIETTGRLRVGNFYARRVRRLLPAALVVVTATCFTFMVLWSVPRRLPLPADARASLLYYANWHFLASAGDYFATNIDKSPFLHFWSLSIEEQFYVFFPILLVLLHRRGRRLLLAVLGVLLVASLTSQVYWGAVDVNHAYYGTDARLYQLLAGALLAVALRRTDRQAAPSSGRADAAAMVGMAGILVLGSGLLHLSPSARGIGATVAAVLLIGGLSLAEAGLLARVLGRPLPVYLGRISYGTYLWHWPVVVALTTILTTNPWFIALLTLGIATGLAALSYQVLEMPIRKAPALDRLGWVNAVVGVSASAVLAVTVVPFLLHYDTRPALATAYGDPAVSAAAGKAGTLPVPRGIDWAKVAADHGNEGSCTAQNVAACTVVHGHGPRVLVVGDSQAESLMPMFEKLAQEHDLTLSRSVTAGCPWQESLVNTKQSASGSAHCTAIRVGWYRKVLPLLHPDVVVLLDRPRDNPAIWGGVIRNRDGAAGSLHQDVYRATTQSLREVSSAVPHTVVIDRLVMPETFDPKDCLSTVKTIGQCAVGIPSTPSATDGYVAAFAAQNPSVVPVDLNPAFCPNAPVCLPIVGGQVVWQDDHHYTASYAVARRQEVWKILQATGAFG